MYQDFLQHEQLVLQAHAMIMLIITWIYWFLAIAVWVIALAGQVWLLCSEKGTFGRRESRDAAPTSGFLGIRHAVHLFLEEPLAWLNAPKPRKQRV